MRYRLLPVLFVLLLPLPAQAEEPFATWVQEFRKDAKAQGITQETLDTAFTDMEPDERVIELDRKQPEGTITLEHYLTNTVTDKRITEGREKLEENRDLLKKIGKTYGVEPRFIVALWGIETNYGGYTGGFSTINSLATLAWEGRRSDFFRGELIKALLLAQQERMSPSDLEGSWAGAMGQCQFMPSTFLAFAVDFDGDGKRDIWNNEADFLASIANYLSSLSWQAGEGWGAPVTLPPDFDHSQIDIHIKKSRKEWQQRNVTTDSDALPDQTALILVGEGDDAQPYLIGDNFQALLAWNRSRYFATAVGTLADAIGQ